MKFSESSEFSRSKRLDRERLTVDLRDVDKRTEFRTSTFRTIIAQLDELDSFLLAEHKSLTHEERENRIIAKKLHRYLELSAALIKNESKLRIIEHALRELLRNPQPKSAAWREHFLGYAARFKNLLAENRYGEHEELHNELHVHLEQGESFFTHTNRNHWKAVNAVYDAFNECVALVASIKK